MGAVDGCGSATVIAAELGKMPTAHQRGLCADSGLCCKPPKMAVCLIHCIDVFSKSDHIRLELAAELRVNNPRSWNITSSEKCVDGVELRPNIRDRRVEAVENCTVCTDYGVRCWCASFHLPTSEWSTLPNLNMIRSTSRLT